MAHPSVMLRKSILDKYGILYDILMEPAEDYALWVKLISYGKLHNLQECLLKYRVHDSQVSSVRNDTQMKSAKQTRLKLLTYLNYAILPEQQKTYLKAIDCTKKLNIQEFLIFLDLKKKMIDVNAGFFSKVDFKKYWIELENKFIRYHFVNRTSYSFVILKNYFFI